MIRVAIVLGLVVWGAGAALGEVISISSLRAGEGYCFKPDFGRLAYYERKCTLEGWDSILNLFLVTAGAMESNLNVNAGTTQYQGHYVWLTNKVVSGFGTYTSSKRSRSFGWIFRNDTGRELKVASIKTTFGQWGARNRLADVLSFDLKVTGNYPEPTEGEGWLSQAADVFTAPYTNRQSEAVFPYFEERSLKVRPGAIPPQSYLAVRFTDTCPAAGNNAHLGIAEFELEFQSALTGFRFWVR